MTNHLGTRISLTIDGIKKGQAKEISITHIIYQMKAHNNYIYSLKSVNMYAPTIFFLKISPILSTSGSSFTFPSFFEKEKKIQGDSHIIMNNIKYK